MSRLQLSSIVNPKLAQAERACCMDGTVSLSDLEPEEIPADAEFVCALDTAGRRLGAVAAPRLRSILSMMREMQIAPLLDELDEAVVAVNLEGIIFYVNPAYSKILGVPAGKILGKDMHIIENGANLLEVLRTGRPITREKQLVQTVQRYVAVRMFPLMSRGEMVGAASIFRDTTEVNRLNLELERASQMAAEYNRQIEAQDVLRQNNVIGESRCFVNSVMKAKAVAATDATVLLRGENGAGKEVFTRLLHRNSARKDKPFIAMNCAAIPESLIESELFGYEEGSFTGARRGGQLGKFQLAEGGTLFLDEIGDMPLPMQAKLLRVLQEGEIEKIGRQRPISVDVRLIAATNQPLERMIEEGRFRQDLFYRLNVVPIEIPPLRARGNDVVLLAAHYLERYNQKYGKQVRISEAVYQMFLKYAWPGNVRELQNVVESCVVLCSQGMIRPEDLPEQFARGDLPGQDTASPMGPGFPERLEEAVAACERATILSALAKSGQSRKKAVEILGIPRRTFYRKVRELQIPLD